MACSRETSTVPGSRESLTMRVMRGTRSSVQDFSSSVEIGSRVQLLVWDFKMRSRTVSSQTLV